MKNNKMVFGILLVVVLLSAFSFRLLNENPVTVFVLKNQVTQVIAVKVDLDFDHGIHDAQRIPLNPQQILEAHDILNSQNLTALEAFARDFGHNNFVIGFLNSENDWSEDWNSFFKSNSKDSFSNLREEDKIYLSLGVHSITQMLPSNLLTLPFTPVAQEPTATLSAPRGVQSTPVISSIVHVEILNGCGIKGAVAWVVRRLKSPQIVPWNGGNANHFSYVHSWVRSHGDISPVLEDACERLGFSKLNIAKGIVPKGYDAVLIIGKDFRRIKGK